MSGVSMKTGGLFDRIGWLLLLFPFLFLLWTARPDLEGGDSAELVTAAHTLGIPHATGYPLYVWLGRIAILLFGSDPARAMNLLSALLGAGAILVAALAAREATGDILAGAVALAGLALARPFWHVASLAEVYTLHHLLLAATLFFLFRWRRTGGERFLWLAVWAAGLDASHHGSALLFAPGYALFVIAHRRLLPSLPRLAAPLLLLPLAFTVYLHLPIRNGADPAVNAFRDIQEKVDLGLLDKESAGDSFGDRFLFKLRGAGPGRKLTWFDDTARENAAGFPDYFRRTAGAFLLPIGLSGLLWGAARRGRSAALLLLYCFLANTLFYVNFRTMDLEDFVLPSTLFLLLGGSLLLADLRRLAPRTGAASFVLPLLLVALAAGNGADLARRAERINGYVHSRTILETERRLLAEDLPEGAHICLPWGRAMAVVYLQAVEGIRTDITVHHLARREYDRVIEEYGGRVPLYVEDISAETRRAWRVVPEAGLFRIEPKGERKSR
ncbi:MAG: DUF2723 domain-containing protein [Candidatus Eisenbacteria bacterium]|nr:DUF2723 domain-containing protein [Candidatus Eisenbacteria bacterium]